MLLINVYYESQILNTSTGASYDIRVACIFSTDESINIDDLKIPIHVGLKLLFCHLNITISAQSNIIQSGSDGFLYFIWDNF
jgi:hypothetical protein